MKRFDVEGSVAGRLLEINELAIARQTTMLAAAYSDSTETMGMNQCELE